MRAEKNSVADAPAPPVRLKPEQVRRTIALVVDDLTISFGSTASVRDALKKFVDQQMQPGDLVAIIRTGAGMGALQQFTNDKRQLYAAIERVQVEPSRGGNIYTFAPVTTDPSQATTQLLKRSGHCGLERYEREYRSDRALSQAPTDFDGADTAFARKYFRSARSARSISSCAD